MVTRVSLQMKIIIFITTIILFVTMTLTGIFAYLESKQVEENMGKLALRVATTVSLIPAVENAFYYEEPSEVIQPLVESIRQMVGAEFIVVGNKDSIRYSHPNIGKIGKKMVGGDNDKALIDGQYYISKAVGSLGPSLRGKAPIFNDKGDIIGIVSVGFMIEDIRSIIINRVLKIGAVSFVIVLFGIAGGILLARNIRKDTAGLEPHEIASLYRERNAILLSIKEGIIAVDEHGRITMINNSAKKMLGIERDCRNELIENVLPNTQMYKVLEGEKTDHDVEMKMRDRIMIVNRIPIIEDGQVVGVVASFRDKTEIQKMLDTIFEIRKYSEEMRAQTHEFTNKLYVLSGLLQLGHYDKAVQMIQTEYSQHETQNKILFDQIHDQTVQAILLGKISIASEKKINFMIDENCTLNPLPKHIVPSQIITMIGNLIDNAFDAVQAIKQKEVFFYITDIGNDVVIEVGDNGPGVDEKELDSLFNRGYSTKEGMNRGYGLTNLKKVVDDLQGSVEIQRPKGGGAVFSIFLPKKLNENQWRRSV